MDDRLKMLSEQVFWFLMGLIIGVLIGRIIEMHIEYLKFKKEKTPVITNIKRISKPGLRVYVTKDEIPRVLRGMGMAVISTSSGILADAQARSLGVGGEVVCYVW